MAFNSSRIGWIAPLFPVLILFAAPRSQDRDSLEVKAVRIHGNAQISDSRIRSVMRTRPTNFFLRRYYQPAVFRRDLRNVIEFYREQGFLQAEIADTAVLIDSLRKTVHIELQVRENQRTHITGLSFTGNAILGDSLLKRQTGLKSGDPLVRTRIREAGMRILDLYGAEGYLDAEVRPAVELHTPNHAAQVVFAIRENEHFVVGNIVIAGLSKTKPVVVRRELTFSPGHPMRLPDFLESQRKLYNTGLFRSVFIEPLRGQTDSGRTNVLVEVRERKSVELSLRAGYGTIERFRGGFSIINLNVAGTGARSELQAQASQIGHGAALSLAQPWTWGYPLHVDARAFYEFREEIGFDFSRLGWQAQAGREFGRSKVLVGFRSENTRTSNLEPTLPPQQETDRIRSVIISANRDTRDDLFNPSQGSYLALDEDLAGLFGVGTASFSRTQVAAKGFFPRRSTIYASAIQVGWIALFDGDSLPLSERFFTGGPNSLRGFRYRSLGDADTNNVPAGGRFKAVLNFEIRRSLYRMLGGAVFADVGNVWSEPADFSLTDIRYDLGFGPRINTPLGVLRFDVAFNISPRAGEDRVMYIVAIGQAF